MGIPKLNRYLLRHCSNRSIDKKHLSLFYGKTIAIDTSIYLYKFNYTDTLIENMFQMIRIFQYYNIKPIFIFDGKPPEEKHELLNKRKMIKNEAETKYNDLSYKCDALIASNDTTQITLANIEDIKLEMEKLKGKFVRVKWTDTQNVKNLLNVMRIEHYTADGEADVLCAHMVLNNVAWACMSDDMDLFVYGCTRVMRFMNLFNHTIMYYNINGILRELKIPMSDFRKIAVMSGTDYNTNQTFNVGDIIKNYYMYKTIETDADFCTWYSQNTKNEIDMEKINHIYDMFSLTDHPFTMKTVERKFDTSMTLSKFLRPYGFVFV